MGSPIHATKSSTVSTKALLFGAEPLAKAQSRLVIRLAVIVATLNTGKESKCSLFSD